MTILVYSISNKLQVMFALLDILLHSTVDDTAASTRRMKKDPYFYMKVKRAMEIK
jgi:hypothetical protein